MEKVKAIYLIPGASTTDGSNDAARITGKNYATGLVIELENGDRYAHLSTDVIVPFEKIDTAVTDLESADSGATDEQQ